MMSSDPPPDNDAHPAGERDEREPTTRVEYRGAGIMWGAIALFVALVVLIVLVLQNTQDVELNALWIDGDAPLSLIVVVVIAVAVVATEAVGFVWRRRSRARRRERDELQRLRSGS